MITEVLGALIAGLVAGVLHVLSGPDHLAAVLPFAVRGRRQALRVGATWGLGHGLGVLLLGAVAVALRSTMHLEAISGAAEVVVGVMLMVLGAWAIRRSRFVEVHAHEHEHELDPVRDAHHVHMPTGRHHEHGHDHGPPSARAPSGAGHHGDARSDHAGLAPELRQDGDHSDDRHRHGAGPRGADSSPEHASRTPQILGPGRRGHHLVRTAHVHLHVHVGTGRDRHQHPPSILGFGLIHGLAGAGHLLGVLPSLAMGQQAAVAYLAAFLVGGLAAMSAFAFLAGRVVRHEAWVPRALALAGATSMVIGAVWIVTSIGLVSSG